MAKRNAQKEQARARAAAIRAQQEAEDRRRRMWIAIATLGVIGLVVVGLVVAALNRPTSGTTQAAASPLSAAATKDLTTVPKSVFDQVGAGTVTAQPKRIKGAQAVRKDGKPQILYVGAEFCPYCAGLRWSMAVAMSRFGTWAPLSTTTSADEGAQMPPLSTISFAQATKTALTSDVVHWSSYETQNNVMRNGSYGKLDDLSGADLELFRRLDAPPHVDQQTAGSIPFASFAGTIIQPGGMYDIALLKGKSADQIAATLKNPSDPLTQAIVGGANVLSAAVCETTGGNPADVCTSTGVKAGAAKIAG